MFVIETQCTDLSQGGKTLTVNPMPAWTLLLFAHHHQHYSHHHSGGASAVKEPGHFVVRKSSSQVIRMHFFPQKSWRPF